MVRRVELEVISLPYKFDVSKVSKREAREIGLGWKWAFWRILLKPWKWKKISGIVEETKYIGFLW